jgi:hypothetical protein
MPIRAATKAKVKPTANNVVPIDPSKFASLNQLELAALYNTSARTIGRRLKGGWKPGTPLPVNRRTSRHSFSIRSAKIIESNQRVPTDVADPARFAPTNADPSAEPADLAEFRADRFDIWSVLVLVVAIGLATVAAYFSVSGMTRIFPGSTIAIIAMASMMEGGKLIGAAWLSRHWRATNWLLRMILVVLLAILALINATGVFGQLSAAHIDPHVEKLVTLSNEAAENDAKIAAQEQLIADNDRQIAQIDTAIEEAEKRGRSSSAMDLARDQRQRREELAAERSTRSSS